MRNFLKFLFVPADCNETEQIAVQIVCIFQVDHKPSLPVSFGGLLIDSPQCGSAVWKESFDGFLFFWSDYDHNGEKGLSGVYGTQRPAGFPEFDIPALFHAAGAEFYFFGAVVPGLYLGTESGENRVIDMFSDFRQRGTISFIL